MSVRFEALCVSEKTNVKIWLAPLLALGDTESAEGMGGGTVTRPGPFRQEAGVGAGIGGVEIDGLAARETRLEGERNRKREIRAGDDWRSCPLR